MADREKVIKGMEKFRADMKPFCGNHADWERFDAGLSMLKEQEPKTGHWIFESQYCEAWSHKCSECGKRMTTAVNTFANWCWNCGAKMKGR